MWLSEGGREGGKEGGRQVSSLSPREFKAALGKHASQFLGYEQQVGRERGREGGRARTLN